MRVLVTGDQGYIGSVLTSELKKRCYEVVGYDIGYYTENLLFPYDQSYLKIKKDIRDARLEDLMGVNAIIHLAGLSNDPLGELAPELTEEINFRATVSLARLAKKAGVSRFIYSSSQSIYGINDKGEELDEDNSDKNPITAYARTKWAAELSLKKMHTSNFCVTCFRPSTVFGASPRLRCDIVYNNLVACAYTTRRIKIKSDGTPWRPVVHIKDVCAAFVAGLEAPTALLGGRSFNVGIPEGNFTVREIAEAARCVLPESKLCFTGEHGAGARTYRVSFQRILKELKDYYKPEWDLRRGGEELVDLFNKISFTSKQLYGRETIRLEQLKYNLKRGILDQDLRYK